MKKIYSLLFAICFCGFANAQITFEKVIDTLGCQYAACVQQTFDGGYIVCGTTYYNNNDAAIIKLDTFGNIQWVKEYGGPGQDGAKRVEQLPDSSYIVFGEWNGGPNSKNWLLRLDINGDTLWTNKLDVGNYQHAPQSMASDLTKNFPITGFINVQGLNNDIYLIVTDSSGAPSISRTYGDSVFSDEGYDITKTFDNGYAITGVNQTAPIIGGIYLIRTDSLGDTLWSRTFFHTRVNVGYSVRQTLDSGFIIAGISFDTIKLKADVYLVKTNLIGDSIWTKIISYDNESLAKCVSQINSSGYIIAGRIVDSLPLLAAKLLLIKTDNNGDTLWTRHYAGISATQGNYVKETTDGGFVAAGVTGLAMYILKTDSLGNVNSGVGINEIKDIADFVVYPNPGSGFFNLKLKKIFQSLKIEVTNCFGVTIISDKIETCNQYALDLSNERDGLYFVTIKNNKTTATKKILLIK